MVFCDSDYAFFRPFGRDDLLVDGKIGLLDIAWQNDNTRRWTTIARRLLGLPHVDGGYRNHVGSMICWNREIVTLMQQRIEVASGMNWRIALALTSDFSEYMIYGILVRELLGYASVDHAPSTVPLVKLCYGVSLHNVSAFDSFFAHLDPRTVAVMIYSKDGVDPILYRRYLEHLESTHTHGNVNFWKCWRWLSFVGISHDTFMESPVASSREARQKFAEKESPLPILAKASQEFGFSTTRCASLPPAATIPRRRISATTCVGSPELSTR